MTESLRSAFQTARYGADAPTEDDEHLIEVAGWLFGSEANQALARRKYPFSVVPILRHFKFGIHSINPSAT